MGEKPQATSELLQHAAPEPATALLNLSVVLPYMQYRKKLRYFNGMYTPSDRYRLLLLLLLIFVLWTFQAGFFKRNKDAYHFGVVLSLSYDFPRGWAPGSAATIFLNVLNYVVMLLIVVLVAAHADQYDPFMQGLGFTCVVLFAVVLSRHSRLPDTQQLTDEGGGGGGDGAARGSFFLTQDFVMQVFVWLALLHMALLAAVRALMPALVRRNWPLVRCAPTERRDLTDPAAVAALIDLPPGYSLAPERQLVACYFRYTTPGWAPFLGRHETITYVGEVDAAGHPAGYGEWRDSHWHGEHLTGFWHGGTPTGPFRSRETGSASGFVNLRVAYFRNRGEALRKAACLPRLQPLQFGIVGCEVSTCGAWFKSLPRLQELLPPVDIAEGLIAEEEAAIEGGRLPPAASYRTAPRSVLLGTMAHRVGGGAGAAGAEPAPQGYDAAGAGGAGLGPRSRLRAVSYSSASVALEMLRAPAPRDGARAGGDAGGSSGDAPVVVGIVREEEAVEEAVRHGGGTDGGGTDGGGTDGGGSGAAAAANDAAAMPPHLPPISAEGPGPGGHSATAPCAGTLRDPLSRGLSPVRHSALTVAETANDAAPTANPAVATPCEPAVVSLEGLAQAERALQAPSLRRCQGAEQPAAGGFGGSGGLPCPGSLTAAAAASAAAAATGLFFRSAGHVPRLVSMLMPLQPAQTTTVQGRRGGGARRPPGQAEPPLASERAVGSVWESSGAAGGEEGHASYGSSAAAKMSAAEATGGGLTRLRWRLRSGVQTSGGLERRSPGMAAGDGGGGPRRRPSGAGRSGTSPSAAAVGGPVLDNTLGAVHHRALLSFLRSSRPFAATALNSESRPQGGGDGGSGGADGDGSDSVRTAAASSAARLRATHMSDLGLGPLRQGSSRSVLLRGSPGRPNELSTPTRTAAGPAAAPAGGRAAVAAADAALQLQQQQQAVQRPLTDVSFDRPPEALLFVHGLGVDMHKALRHYAQMMALIGFPPYITPVLFSWPSSVPVAYFWARYRGAEPPETGLALAATVRALAADGFSGLHILVHSMGTRVLYNALPHLEAILGGAGGQDGGGQAAAGGAGSAGARCNTYGSESTTAAARKGGDGGTSGGDGGGGGDVMRMRLRTVTICNPDFGLRRFVEDMGPRLRALCSHVTLYGDTADGALALSEVVNALARPFVGATAAIAGATIAVQERAMSAAAYMADGAAGLIRPQQGPQQQIKVPPEPPPPPGMQRASWSYTRAHAAGHKPQRAASAVSEGDVPAMDAAAAIGAIAVAGGGAHCATGNCELPQRPGSGAIAQVGGSGGGGGSATAAVVRHPNAGLCDTPNSAAGTTAAGELPGPHSPLAPAPLPPPPSLPSGARRDVSDTPSPPVAPAPPPPPPPPPSPPLRLSSYQPQLPRLRSATQQPAPQAAQLEVVEASKGDGSTATAGIVATSAVTIPSTPIKASVSRQLAMGPLLSAVEETPTMAMMAAATAVTETSSGPANGAAAVAARLHATENHSGGDTSSGDAGVSGGNGGKRGGSDASLAWWSERVVNYRRRLRRPPLYRWLEHSLGRRIYQVTDPATAAPLDIDVIDLSYLCSNVNSVRHTHFALNREILDDLWEVIVCGRRAFQRTSRLEHVTGNVFSIAVAPAFISTRQL